MTEFNIDACAFGRTARAAPSWRPPGAGSFAALLMAGSASALAQTAPAANPAATNAPAAKARATPRTADYILAIVNQELVTNGELEQRIARVRDAAQRNGTRLPPPAELRQQLLDALIDERVQVTHARENGARVDEAELDRAVANVAAQNQVTMTQLRQRLTAEGMDFQRFRNNI